MKGMKLLSTSLLSTAFVTWSPASFSSRPTSSLILVDSQLNMSQQCAQVAKQGSGEVTELGLLTPANQRNIPYHRTLRSAIKAGGGRRKGGTFRVVVSVFPSNCYVWRSPIFLEVVQHLPVSGKYHTPASFALLASVALLHLLNHLYCKHRVFSLLPFWLCPPSCTWGVWARTVWGLSCWLEFIYHTCWLFFLWPCFSFFVPSFGVSEMVPGLFSTLCSKYMKQVPPFITCSIMHLLALLSW